MDEPSQPERPETRSRLFGDEHAEELTPALHAQDREYIPAAILFLCGLSVGMLTMTWLRGVLSLQSPLAMMLTGQLPYQVFGFAFALFGLLPVARRHGWQEALGFRADAPGVLTQLWRNLPLLIGFFILVTLVNLASRSICHYLNIPVAKQAIETYGRQDPSLIYWACAAFLAVILAPVTEELLFRQVVFRAIRYVVPLWATVLTCVLFGLAHGNAVFLPGLAVLAYGFQSARLRGGITRSILLHGMYNLLSYLILWLSVFSSQGTP